jgi:hypothetical protein
MRAEPCYFESLCRKVMATKGSTVTVRTKSFGMTGHRSKVLLAFLEELGCWRIRESRAYKMVCPKAVMDELCQGFARFFTRLKQLGLY